MKDVSEKLTETLRQFGSPRMLIKSDHFYGLRLFACRDENDDAMADCRVNGEDWEEGKEALCAYVNTWPQAGVEFRKQYVVVQSV